MLFHFLGVSIAVLDDSVHYFLLEQKIIKKTANLVEFLVLAEILGLQSDFPGLLWVFSISRWQINFVFRI